MEFCMLMNIGMLDLNGSLKIQNFKNPTWQKTIILKTIKCDISTTIWPISMNFWKLLFTILPDKKSKKLSKQNWLSLTLSKSDHYKTAKISILFKNSKHNDWQCLNYLITSMKLGR